MSYSVQHLFKTLPVSPRNDQIEWEDVGCLLCGSDRRQLLLEAQDVQGRTGNWFAVVQCQECGLCYVSPRPVADQLDRFYPTDYRPHQLKAMGQPGLLKKLLMPLRGASSPFLPKEAGKLLDFGCGGGSFLQKMHAQGWEVTGLDVAQTTVERVRAETGLNVLVGSLPHPELEPGSFDAITMWHALEHVPNPSEVLQAARDLLTPTGRLLVAVPNIDSFAFRTFGQHWFGLDLPRHLTHFAPWTLHLMLERAGFHVERVRMVRSSAWLRHSARRACHYPQANAWHRWMRGKFLSRLAAFYSCVTYQSDVMLVTAWPARTPAI